MMFSSHENTPRLRIAIAASSFEVEVHGTTLRLVDSHACAFAVSMRLVVLKSISQIRDTLALGLFVLVGQD